MAIFEGAGVALVTPFTESGEVNYEKLETLLEEQIAGGTDAIIACGTTGESATMSHEEHLDVQLSSFVTVADVNKVKMYMKNFGEFYDDQISHASCIILSRTQNSTNE